MAKEADTGLEEVDKSMSIIIVFPGIAAWCRACMVYIDGCWISSCNTVGAPLNLHKVSRFLVTSPKSQSPMI